MSIHDFRTPPELVAALGKRQITGPTPIQTTALRVLLGGKDAYLHTETGTGKTLACLLPLFCTADSGLAAMQIVIVEADQHRTGRTGRSGTRGLAVSLLTDPELRMIRRYQQELDIAMQQVRLRGGQIVPIEPVELA